MMPKKENNPKIVSQSGAIVRENVGNYEKHPFFVKKANRAKAYLKEVGLPPKLGRKSD
jgi:hypothetical protein